MGRAWELVPVASDQNWGAASTQLVHALWDEHALAIVALDRDAAHLSEQLALKAFVPVVALCNDKALTSTNVPWIFRLPAGTTPASGASAPGGGCAAQRTQSGEAAGRSCFGERIGWSRIPVDRRAAREVGAARSDLRANFNCNDQQKGQPGSGLPFS